MLPGKPLAYGCSYKNREAWNKVIGQKANKWRTNYLSWETT